MNISHLSDYQLLALFRAVDSEARKRKVQKSLPTGSVAVEGLALIMPDADLTRKAYLRAPSIHLSPLAMAAYVGQKAGCVGGALQNHIVDALSVAAAGNLHQSLALAGVDEAAVKAIKKAIAEDCPKVETIRTSVDWK